MEDQWSYKAAHNVAYVCKSWFDFNFFVCYFWQTKFHITQYIYYVCMHRKLCMNIDDLAGMQQILDGTFTFK